MDSSIFIITNKQTQMKAGGGNYPECNYWHVRFMIPGEAGKPGYGQEGRDGQRGPPGTHGQHGVPGPPGAAGPNGYCDPSSCNLQAGAAHQSLDVKGPAGN